MTARWWIGNSAGEVKVVILIFINQIRADIGFEIWEDVLPQNPRRTRSHARGQQHYPTRTQVASATLPSPLQPITVAGAPLVLPFRSVFLRDPNSLETDISLSQQDIESVVRAVWREQGFL